MRRRSGNGLVNNELPARLITGQPRRYYRVTDNGVAAARQAMTDLEPSWNDRHLRTLESL